MKKIFTLIAIAMMAISANAQTNSYAIVKDDPNVGSSKSITAVDNITATFDAGEWSVGGGSSDGGTVDGIEFKKYAVGTENKQSVTFTPTIAGTLTIYFGGDVATSKAIFMTEGENGLTGTTLVNNETIESGNKPASTLAKWKDGIKYSLEANKSYAFAISGTKWRFAGFKFVGGTSGINSVKTAAENSAIYNLAGQQVDKNYKGVVIQNGKKMIQK